MRRTQRHLAESSAPGSIERRNSNSKSQLRFEGVLSCEAMWANVLVRASIQVSWGVNRSDSPVGLSHNMFDHFQHTPHHTRTSTWMTADGSWPEDRMSPIQRVSKIHRPAVMFDQLLIISLPGNDSLHRLWHTDSQPHSPAHFLCSRLYTCSHSVMDNKQRDEGDLICTLSLIRLNLTAGHSTQVLMFFDVIVL